MKRSLFMVGITVSLFSTGVSNAAPPLKDQPFSVVIREVNAFRKENGHWKLLHRHADPLIDTTAPASVLKP